MLDNSIVILHRVEIRAIFETKFGFYFRFENRFFPGWWFFFFDKHAARIDIRVSVRKSSKNFILGNVL